MTKRLAPVVLIVAVFIFGSTAMASNMGFKISIPLKAYSSSPYHDGNNFASLPYYNSFTTASSVFSDVPGCNLVMLYDNANANFRMYDGFIFTDDFPVSSGGELVDGTALVVQVGADTPWVVVGSHHDSKAIPLKAYSASPYHDGNNVTSIPYHTTKTNASGIFSEIANCNLVMLYDNANANYRMYDGFIFTDDFPLTAGVPIVIQVGVNGSWIPAHY